MNNALKHSGATEIIIQMVQDNNRISLNVPANGKGFNKNMVEKSNNIGLHSIKSRVASLNGLIDIYSEEGKGSEISIEFSF